MLAKPVSMVSSISHAVHLYALIRGTCLFRLGTSGVGLKGVQLMKKKRFRVWIEWVDIFGGKHEAELVCKNEEDMLKKGCSNRMRLKHDSFVQSYTVIEVVR